MSSSHESQRRVVITGVGVLSPLGVGAEAVWQKLASRQSGIGPVRLMESSAAPGNFGGEVWDFDDGLVRSTFPKRQRKSARMMCREIQQGALSALLALEHAGLDLDAVDHERFGVEFGANLMVSPPEVLKEACWRCVHDDDPDRQFHFEDWGTAGMSGMEPLWLLKYLPNMPACHIAIFTNACGPNNSLTLDEVSATVAIGEGLRVISRGAADVMLAGATGTRLQPIKTIHAALWDDLAESDGPPETWCRPFDRDRTGQVLAEGAGAFLLEEESHARSRGAAILGRVLGAGSSCAADGSGQPDVRQAMVNAMRWALQDAGLSPKDVGHVNAHGLATQESDCWEAQAIGEVFGRAHDGVPVTALKSYFGNSGSACGALELAGSLLGLQHRLVLATLNYDTPDDRCPVNVVHGEHVQTGNRVFLTVNATRIGQAGALVVAAE